MIDKRIGLTNALPILLGLIFDGWLEGCGLGKVASSPVIQPQPTATAAIIVFESLAQGDSYIAELENPALFVAGSAAEVSRFTEWLNYADLATRIQEADFNATWVIAVFRGRTESSGYGIAVQASRLTAGTVRFIVSLTNPAPGQNVSDVIS